MPVTNWNLTYIDGVQYLVIDVAKFRIPVEWDPSSNMFIAVAAPDGGLGSFPALVKGDDGDTPDIDTVIDFEALTWDDPTPAYASFTEIASNVYQLSLGLHEGEPGDVVPFALENATDLDGSILADYIIVVNATSDGFEYQVPRCGDRFIPATINNTPTGNPGYTLCSVAIPPMPWDWRPEVEGQCIVTGTGSDVTVDLVARLDDATSGNEVGRALGQAGQNPPTHVLFSGPPTGSSDSYDKVSANTSATVYLRAERQSGADTFSTSATDTRFKVRVHPVPAV